MREYLESQRGYLSEEGVTAAIARSVEVGLLDDHHAVNVTRVWYRQLNLHCRDARLAQERQLRPQGIPLDGLAQWSLATYAREVDRAEKLLEEATRLDARGKSGRARQLFMAARTVAERVGRFDLAQVAAYLAGDKSGAMVYQELEELLDHNSRPSGAIRQLSPCGS